MNWVGFKSIIGLYCVSIEDRVNDGKEALCPYEGTY